MRVDISLVAMRLWGASKFDPGHPGIDHAPGTMRQARVAILKSGGVEQTVASDPRGKEEGVLVYLDPYDRDFYPMLKSYTSIHQVLQSSALFSMIARKLRENNVEINEGTTVAATGRGESLPSKGIGIYNQTGGYD